MRGKACRSRCRRWPTLVGACASLLIRSFALIEAHVMAAERLHGDDSVLQKHIERMIEMV